MGQKLTQEESVNSTDCFWPQYAVTSHSHRSIQYYAGFQAGSANVYSLFPTTQDNIQNANKKSDVILKKTLNDTWFYFKSKSQTLVVWLGKQYTWFLKASE